MHLDRAVDATEELHARKAKPPKYHDDSTSQDSMIFYDILCVYMATLLCMNTMIAIVCFKLFCTNLDSRRMNRLCQ